LRGPRRKAWKVKGKSSSRVREVSVAGSPIDQSARLPWPRKADDGKTPLGVDVDAKRMDIVKIVHKYFKVHGVEMNELLQEVYLAIIHKNYGRSAHDPRKSSFGHYVYMVANNVCINLVHRKKRTDMEKDSIDAPSGPDDKRTLIETVAAEDFSEPNGFDSRMEELELLMRRKGMWDLARYVRAARSGAKPDVIREALSWGDRKMTTKGIRDIRAQLADVVREAPSYAEAQGAY
jgi:DNA-directed RNA polymerase specialized sigma24 family protein